MPNATPEPITFSLANRFNFPLRRKLSIRVINHLQPATIPIGDLLMIVLGRSSDKRFRKEQLQGAFVYPSDLDNSLEAKQGPPGETRITPMMIIRRPLDGPGMAKVWAANLELGLKLEMPAGTQVVPVELELVIR